MSEMCSNFTEESHCGGGRCDRTAKLYKWMKEPLCGWGEAIPSVYLDDGSCSQHVSVLCFSTQLLTQKYFFSKKMCSSDYINVSLTTTLNLFFFFFLTFLIRFISWTWNLYLTATILTQQDWQLCFKVLSSDGKEWLHYLKIISKLSKYFVAWQNICENPSIPLRVLSCRSVMKGTSSFLIEKNQEMLDKKKLKASLVSSRICAEHRLMSDWKPTFIFKVFLDKRTKWQEPGADKICSGNVLHPNFFWGIAE